MSQINSSKRGEICIASKGMQFIQEVSAGGVVIYVKEDMIASREGSRNSVEGTEKHLSKEAFRFRKATEMLLRNRS